MSIRDDSARPVLPALIIPLTVLHVIVLYLDFPVFRNEYISFLNYNAPVVTTGTGECGNAIILYTCK